jgi:hypothetical protein
MPRIAGEIRRDDVSRTGRAHLAECVDIEAHVNRPVRLQVVHPEAEEADRWAQTPTVFRMIGSKKLLLQMDKGSGDLNQALEEGMVFVAPPQPEMFEDVMSFVIPPLVETFEIALVTRIKRGVWIGPELLDKRGNSVGFVHSRREVGLQFIPRSSRSLGGGAFFVARAFGRNYDPGLCAIRPD